MLVGTTIMTFTQEQQASMGKEQQKGVLVNINSGWEFGGHADAAAKASDKGAAVGGEALLDGITIYQLTQSGLALQATVKGTKYWQDDELD